MPITISRNVDAVIQALSVRDVPTVGDMVFVGLQQRTRILERTARGLDVDERPFAPYSRRGPYYHYPAKRTAGVKRRVAAARRLAKRLGLERTAKALGRRGTPYGGTTPGGGIKFRSYAEFKSSLGRGTVDLRGPRAPHMLQALVVRMAGVGDVRRGAVANETPANEVRIGIYGEPARRAEGHQLGAARSRLPRRRFLGANQRDQELAARALEKRRLKRVIDRLKGTAAA